MKKTVVFLLLLVLAMTGCTNKEATSSPLTAEELSYFNDTAFFNKVYVNNCIDSINIRNQFLSSYYADAKDIDLFELFYNGSGVEESMRDEELLAAVIASGNGDSIEDLPCPCQKISAANMDAILQEHMGLSLADTNQIGLDQFTYLADYTSYYNIHGDTNYRIDIAFSSGQRQGTLIFLTYTDNFSGGGNAVLTLQEKDGGYLFVSNQKA